MPVDKGITRIHVVQEPSLTKIIEADGKVVKVASEQKPAPSITSQITEAVLEKINSGIELIKTRLSELSRFQPQQPPTIIQSPQAGGKPDHLCQTANPVAHSNVSVIINDASGKPREIQVSKTEAPTLTPATHINGTVELVHESDDSSLDEGDHHHHHEDTHHEKEEKHHEERKPAKRSLTRKPTASQKSKAKSDSESDKKGDGSDHSDKSDDSDKSDGSEKSDKSGSDESHSDSGSESDKEPKKKGNVKH